MDDTDVEGDPGGEATAEQQRDETPAQGRGALWVRRISLVIVAIGLVILVRMLPAAHAIEALVDRVDELGTFAPFAFIGLYAVVTVLALPASVLSLAAGALFGIATGTIAVATGATIGMAATFLIARYLARPAVARRVARSPRFAAIDRAVAEGGWKIVALLRLSPAVPFNLQNYLYGLTAIRFWPCILASAVSILPGTFMYVYLGYAGRASLGALSGADASRDSGQWALLIVGLAATVAATIYITKLARRAIREQTPLNEEAPKMTEEEKTTPAPARNPRRGTMAAAVLAILVLAIVGVATLRPNWLGGLFGPPAVSLKEAYSAEDDGATFDHAVFDRLLKAHVNNQGGVNYAALQADAAPLQEYIDALADAPFETLGRDGKLALLINAYNAFTLQLIVEWLDEGITSIEDIPAAKRWDDARWNIGGNTWSLNAIEHEQIRPKFEQPNIHFALVCAAVGCPPLRSEAYTADRVEAQLYEQAMIVHTDGSRWFDLDSEGGTIRLTQLYNWYGGDFEQVAGSVLEYAARYSPALATLLEADTPPAIDWLEYDWALNSQENLK